MLVSAAAISVLMVLCTKGAVRLLMGNPSETVMQNACAYMNVISVFYFLCFWGNAFVGYYRGNGMIKIPVIGTTLHIAVRAILSWYLIGRMGLEAVALATGIGWICVVVFHGSIYLRLNRKAGKNSGKSPENSGGLKLSGEHF